MSKVAKKFTVVYNTIVVSIANQKAASCLSKMFSWLLYRCCDQSILRIQTSSIYLAVLVWAKGARVVDKRAKKRKAASSL